MLASFPLHGGSRAVIIASEATYWKIGDNLKHIILGGQTVSKHDYCQLLGMWKKSLKFEVP
jgi:hypothetical protein